MPGASLALFADLGACHVQKSSVTICVLPASFRRGRPAVRQASTATISNFYPRPPGGGRPLVNRIGKVLITSFLSTPSGWRATRAAPPPELLLLISIHALRVEGDCFFEVLAVGVVEFLSTPSGWRATSEVKPMMMGPNNFYPRPPGGGRRWRYTRFGAPVRFLSTPSGWRATRVLQGPVQNHLKFLSTPSGWRATPFPGRHIRRKSISIHALRVEGDRRQPMTKDLLEDFYPRPPGGGRQEAANDQRFA